MSIMTRGTDSAGKQIIAGAINVKAIEISNFRRGNTSRKAAFENGSLKDITRIVATLVITESIDSPTLVLKLGIKDSAGFAETFPIIGQEIIKITTEESNVYTTTVEEKELIFYVTNYPKYGKGNNENVAGYTIEGISKHAYLNGFKKISRGYKDPSSIEISNILQNDLEIDPSKINVNTSNDISKSKGVINIQPPLAAAAFFRKNTFDSMGSPYFLFETLDGKINFTSLSEMAKQKPIGPYKEVRGMVYNPETFDSFMEDKKRILSILSDLNLSNYKKGRLGAFASKNNYLDWSDKSYKTKNYNYFAETDKNATIESEYIISSRFRLFDDNPEPLSQLPDAKNHFISKNDNAFTEDINYGSAVSKKYHKLNANLNLLNTYTHVLELVGDTRLNAGKIIEIEIPSAIDPELRQSAVEYDPNMSGKYLITSVRHKIENGKYFSTVYISRDSFSAQMRMTGGSI